MMERIAIEAEMSAVDMHHFLLWGSLTGYGENLSSSKCLYIECSPNQSIQGYHHMP